MLDSMWSGLRSSPITGGRKAKLSPVIFTELLMDDAVDLVLNSEITNALAFRFEAKSLARQNP